MHMEGVVETEASSSRMIALAVWRTVSDPVGSQRGDLDWHGRAWRCGLGKDLLFGQGCDLGGQVGVLDPGDGGRQVFPVDCEVRSCPF